MIRSFAYIIIVIAGLSIFISLYNALKDRKYDLAIMPGADQVKAVAQVDAHLPVRIAQELGIWCDEDEEEPMNRRALAEAEGAEGIYKLTSGEPDLVRTDGKLVA